MQHATLPGRHDRKGVWLTTIFDCKDRRGSRVAKILIPIRLERVGIERNPIVLVWLQAKDLRRDVFDRVKKFAIPLREQRRIGAT